MNGRTSRSLLRAHAVVVLLAGVALLATDVARGDAADADVGGGLVFLLLMVLALPWSLVLAVVAPVLGTATEWPAWQGDLAVVLLAFVNVVLHLRRYRTQEGTPGTCL